MALDTITHEEFEKRLAAVNERLRQKLEAIEAQQAAAEKLLSQYEHTLSEIEAELALAKEPIS